MTDLLVKDAFDKAFGCDHKCHAEHLRVCVEGKCCGCGQIKFRKVLEECLAGNDKVIKP